MATTGLEVFDKTLHTTNLWLDEINAEIGPDRHLAWRVLGAVLRSIRDEMQVEQSAHFAAQLPLLIRGAYFDQYRPAAQPASVRSHDDFIACIQHDLDGTRPINVQQAAAAVMRTLNRHVTEGQVKKVRDALPKAVRAMWPEPEHWAPEHKAPAQREPEHAGHDQAAKGAEPARSAGQPAQPSTGSQRTLQHSQPQHAAAQPPASQHAAPQPAAAPQPPAHGEREDIDAAEDELSSKSAHVPIGAARRPAQVHAAPPAERTASGRKAKMRTKRTDD